MKHERGTTMWIEIQRTDAEQPFHVVFKAGNGHETFWCENLVTRANALRVIKKHAEGFVGHGNAKVVKAPLVASGLALQLFGVAPIGGIEPAIEIRERDLRS